MSGLLAEQWALFLGDTRPLCAWLRWRAHHLLTSHSKACDRQWNVLKMCLVVLTHIASHTALRDTWIWFKVRPWKGLILAYSADRSLSRSLFFLCSIPLSSCIVLSLFITLVMYWACLVLLFGVLYEAKFVVNVGIHPASHWASFHL